MTSRNVALGVRSVDSVRTNPMGGERRLPLRRCVRASPIEPSLQRLQLETVLFCKLSLGQAAGTETRDPLHPLRLRKYLRRALVGGFMPPACQSSTPRARCARFDAYTLHAAAGEPTVVAHRTNRGSGGQILRLRSDRSGDVPALDGPETARGNGNGG